MSGGCDTGYQPVRSAHERTRSSDHVTSQARAGSPCHNWSAMLDKVLQTIDGRKKESLAALKELLAIPSVSTKPDHKPDMQRCANWLSDKLKAAKLDVQILPTGGGKGHPIVIARNAHQSERPTILFYGHYDVQPP